MSSSKRPRLADFGHESYLTAAALSKVLTKIADEGLPDARSASSVLRDVKRDSDQQTPYGPVVQSTVVHTSNGDLELPFQHPFAMLWAATQQWPDLKRRLKELDNQGPLSG